MNCRVCNLQLPQGAAVCPRCGTPVTPYGPGPNPEQRPDIASHPSPSPYYNVPPAQTNYGNNYPPTPPVYGLDPYHPSSSPQYPPHTNPPYTPPPDQPRAGKKRRTGWLIGISLLVIVLLIIGSIYLVTSINHNNQVSASATATALVSQQNTPDAAKNPYLPNTGTLVLNDPMHDNSKGYKWDETTMNSPDGKTKSTCGFSQGAYHITRSAAGALTCNPEATGLILSNLIVETKLTVVKGHDAGIVFRIDQSTAKGYVFAIDISGGYHFYAINFNTTDLAQQTKTLFDGTTAAIKQGLNQPNLLAIVANGSTISLYINGQFIRTSNDSTFTTGQFGFYAGNDRAEIDVTAADTKVWKI